MGVIIPQVLTEDRASGAYLIDGQALDASYFGYTDPLTNTWRPKKLSSSVAFGTNGFFLPFDGSAPIGQDQSGRGNNWTPVNFGGSNTLEKATGALPILNTDGGGKVARVGVRTDSSASSLVLALPLVGNANDVSHLIDSGESQKTVTVSGATAISSFSNFYGGSYDFDGSNDKITVTGGSGRFAGQSDFTLECWYYLDAITTDCGLLSTTNSFGSNTRSIIIGPNASGNSKITFIVNPTGSGGWTTVENSLTAITGKWTHVALTYTASTTTCQAFVDGVKLGSASVTPYNNQDANLHIGVNGGDGSGYFNGKVQDVRWTNAVKYTQNFIPASTDPDILPDTPSGVAYSSNVALVPSTDGAVAFDGSGDYLSFATNSDFGLASGDDFTIECFTYATAYTNSTSYSEMIRQGTSNAGSDGTYFNVNSTGTVSFRMSGTTKTTTGSLNIGGWNHIAVCRASGTVYIAINGIVENFGSVTNSSTTGNFRIGADFEGNNFYKGQLSNVHFVKGTALYTSNFTPPSAPLTSVQNTKLLCCKSNSSATAADVTPGTITANGNTAATNFNPFTVNINTQRGQESGYCTWNPLAVQQSGHGGFSDGNLEITADTAGSHKGTLATFAIPSTGRWYWEVKAYRTGATNNGGGAVGVAEASAISASAASGTRLGEANSSSWVLGLTTFDALHRGTSDYADYLNGGTVVTDTGIIGIAVDMDNDKMWMHYNGIYGNAGGTGNPVTGVNPMFSGEFSGLELFPAGGISVDSGSGFIKANWGQKPFKFPPPAGFQPLALANTPRPSIVRPDQYVGVTTYIGTSGATSVSNLQFKPDLVWLKNRDSGDGWHQWRDSVRGGDKNLASNSSIAESDASTKNLIFNSNGFTLTGTTDSRDDNYDGDDYVAWCWKAGGNSNTFNIDDVGYDTASAAGLTAGTITPTGASVNTKSGFSIITYTGNGSVSTIGHGLGVPPSMIIVKSRSQSGESWFVRHSSLGYGWLVLNAVNSYDNRTQIFTATSPTSSVFSLSGDLAVNNNTSTYVAYCWAEIPGFSKFGSYTGNGSAAGPMIATMFRPRWVLFKKSSAAGDPWLIYDSVRDTFNVAEWRLAPNNSGADSQSTVYSINLLSNGFKINTDDTSWNASGATFIYAAFAETPTFNLYGGQSNAR
jgi:hypothetical protein